MQLRLALVLLLLGACLKSDLVPCGELLCSADQVCIQDQCVAPALLAACEGLPDGAPCMGMDVPAYCENGFCKLAICGNGTVEPSEACDDGDNMAGDGCSADCASLETCGNDVVDAITGEECDRGTPGLSGDGCTSSCKVEFDTWRDLTPRTLSPRHRARLVFDSERGEHVLFGGYDGAQTLDETWVYKAGAWNQRFPASSPEPRYGHAMVYDAFRKKVVLFGGTNGTDMFRDTWEWNGAAWTKLPIATPPLDRQDAGMVYNPDDRTVYMFGGMTRSGIGLGDTWTFDGTAWTKHMTAGPQGSTAIEHASLAYDNAANKLVMVGESVAAPGTVAIYQLDTTRMTWSEQHTVPVPAFIDPVFTWDPLRQKVVLFGGHAGSIASGSRQTLELDGATLDFTVVPVLGGDPFARSQAAGAGGPTGLVMFGGIGTGGQMFGDSWIRADVMGVQRWRKFETNPAPVARVGAMATYDPVRRNIIYFGGAYGSAAGSASAYAETWLWQEPTWSQVGSVVAPSPRAFGALAFDENAEVAILFGGTDPGGVSQSGEPVAGCGSGWGSGSGSGSGTVCQNELNDTWTFKNGLWSWLALSMSPSPRILPAMTYDAERERILLFGGRSGSAATPHSDTWSLQAGAMSWTRVMTATTPTALFAPQLAYDRKRKRAVLYGLFGTGVGARGELWELDDTDWKQVPAGAVVPPPRTGTTFVYQPLRERVVLSGGRSPSGQLIADTWEWDGTTWTLRSPVQSPPLRQSAAATFDAVHGRVVVFGGIGRLGVWLDDIWSYGFEAPVAPVESCAPGVDADGDNLAGCADPDCWATCTPACPPGLSCP